MAQKAPQLLGHDVGNRRGDGGLVPIHDPKPLGTQGEQEGIHGPSAEEEQRHHADHDAAVALGDSVVGLDIHFGSVEVGVEAIQHAE